jgi:hypothetical protein
MPVDVEFGNFAITRNDPGIACCLDGRYARIVLGVGTSYKSRIHNKNNIGEFIWQFIDRMAERIIGSSFG